MKIVLLFCAPLPITFAVKLNTDFIIKNKFHLEYWNMSKIFFSKKELENYYAGNSNFRHQYNSEVFFENKKEFIDRLKELKKNEKNFIFWCWDFNNYNDFWIRYLFKKYDINYFVGPKRTPFKNFLIKNKKFKRYTSERILKAFKKKFDFEYIYKNIFLFLFKKTNLYKHPIFILGSGKLGQNIYKNFFPRSEFLEIPSFDVDWTFNNRETKKYCVYVDDAIDFGKNKKFDQRENSFFSCNDIDSFYSNLRKFFDKIELIYNTKVVIAASGKFFHSDLEKFGNRKIFYNETNKLINNSNIVIGHESSGLWQAVISKKKMILLDDPSFTEIKKRAIKNMSIFLDLKVFDLNTISKKNIIDYFNYYNKNYDNLIYQYFSTNLKLDEFKFILVNKLNKIMNRKYETDK